jgi:hypothetical protein
MEDGRPCLSLLSEPPTFGEKRTSATCPRSSGIRTREGFATITLDNLTKNVLVKMMLGSDCPSRTENELQGPHVPSVNN